MGYEPEWIEKILYKALKVYERVLHKVETGEMTRNRMGYQSAHTGRYKKLFGQTSWFTKKKEDHPKEAPEKESPKVPQKKRKRPRTGDKESSESKEKVVLFIPHTFRGELKDMLQEMERDMKGDKVKYVEMMGQSIGSQLIRQDP